MGVIGIAVTLLLVAAGGVVAVGGVLYASDYGLQADVQDKHCGLSINVISVKTDLFGIEHDVAGVPEHECGIIQVGDRVVYHVRSQHTILYRDGQVCYDSETGPAVACAAGLSEARLL